MLRHQTKPIVGRNQDYAAVSPTVERVGQRCSAHALLTRRMDKCCTKATDMRTLKTVSYIAWFTPSHVASAFSASQDARTFATSIILTTNHATNVVYIVVVISAHFVRRTGSSEHDWQALYIQDISLRRSQVDFKFQPCHRRIQYLARK